MNLSIDMRIIRGIIFAFVICLTGFYVYRILDNPQWIAGDDNHILTTTASGKMMPLLISVEFARFWPLGYFEYNLLIPFGNNPIAYYVYSAAKLILAVFLLGLALRKINRTLWPVFLLMFLLIPQVFSVYTEVVYPESTLIILLSLFCYFYLQALAQGSRAYQVVAILSAVAATYMKEPICVAFLAFAVGGIFVLEETDRKFMRPLHTALILNGLLFVALYCIVILRKYPVTPYTQQFPDMTLVKALADVWYDDRLLFVAALIAVIRLVSIVKGNKNISDILLFAGTSYAAAFFLIGIYASYYMLPAYVFFFTALCGYVRISKKVLMTAILIALPMVSLLSQLHRIPEYVLLFAELRRETPAMIRRLDEVSGEGYELLYLPDRKKSEFMNHWHMYCLNVLLEKNSKRKPQFKLVQAIPQNSRAVVVTSEEAIAPHLTLKLIGEFHIHEMYRLFVDSSPGLPTR